MSEFQTIKHGRYVIKSGRIGNVWRANAFHRLAPKSRPGDGPGKNGTLASAAGDQRQDAIAELIRVLDEDDRLKREARRHDPSVDFDVPTAEEFETAIRLADLTKAEIGMLVAHAGAGDDGMTAGELATAAGYQSFSSANLHYGLCGGKLCDAIGIIAPKGSDRSRVPTAAMARPGDTKANGEFVWVMHFELRQAVKRLL